MVEGNNEKVFVNIVFALAFIVVWHTLRGFFESDRELSEEELNQSSILFSIFITLQNIFIWLSTKLFLLAHIIVIICGVISYKIMSGRLVSTGIHDYHPNNNNN